MRRGCRTRQQFRCHVVASVSVFSAANNPPAIDPPAVANPPDPEDPDDEEEEVELELHAAAVDDEEPPLSPNHKPRILQYAPPMKFTSRPW
eukprot:scaffold75760_cov60-Cyclotella_meneghiniana.AAC.16